MRLNPSAFLQVKNLHITFVEGEEVVEAVKGISFSLEQGQTLAVVGESGSGKSVTALSLTQLLPKPPHCQVSGQVLWQGRDLLKASKKEIRHYRGKEIAYIFQEPSSSLNPVFSIGHQIVETIKRHRPEIKNVEQTAIHALERVGIRYPQKRLHDYPYQFSGGMQQRVMIALALASQPRLLVADEPTTALDATIQVQILDLLKRLKQEFQMAIILITHNFGIVAGFADKVIVMFRGKIVEAGSTLEVLSHPRHPYTQALLACIPQLGKKQKRLPTIDTTKIDSLVEP